MGSLRIVTTTTASNPVENDLYIDDSGQLEWIGGDITDKEDYSRMVLQRIWCRLRFVKGEWYLDQRQGTPWKEKIWVKGVTESTVKRVIREVVVNTPGVEALNRLDVSIDKTTRLATITITATSDLGTVVTTDILDNPFVVEVPND
jgi:hypothetical protein